MNMTNRHVHHLISTKLHCAPPQCTLVENYSVNLDKYVRCEPPNDYVMCPFSPETMHIYLPGYSTNHWEGVPQDVLFFSVNCYQLLGHLHMGKGSTSNLFKHDSIAVNMRDQHITTCDSPTLSIVGFLSRDDIVENVKPLFYTRMRMGEFDPPEMNPYNKANMSVVMSPAFQKLAIKAAQQSFVLLKNEKNVLPLTGNYSKVAVRILHFAFLN